MKAFRSLTLCLVASACLFAIAGIGRAHRVNIFAYVEAGMVKVECGFSKTNRVKNGELIVSDPVSGEVFLTGRTDDQGDYAFPIPEAAIKAGNGLRILLKAGEGHQNEWTVPAETLRDSSSVPAPALEADATPASASTAELSAAPLAPGAEASSAHLVAGCDAELLAGIVEQAVERKVSPLRQMLLEQTMQGPGVKDIIGGIGYIFGLVGIAAYFMSKRR